MPTKEPQQNVKACSQSFQFCHLAASDSSTSALQLETLDCAISLQRPYAIAILRSSSLPSLGILPPSAHASAELPDCSLCGRQSPAMSGKRKRTKEEKQWAKTHTYSNVTCKLGQVCPHPDLVEEIQHSCVVLKQIQSEAWHIANLHLQRCFRDKLELPTLDQAFFLWCCQAARAEGMQAAPPRTISEDHRRYRLDVLATAQLYRERRETTENYNAPERLLYESSAINSIAAQMRVNAQNMVVLHFGKRLAMAVRLMVEARTPEPFPRPVARRLTPEETAAERATKRAVNADVKRLVAACYCAENSQFQQDERELRDWLGMPPHEEIIEHNLEHFVGKLHEIQQIVEASQTQDPTKKGIQGFTLLPYSSSYVPLHMMIDGSGLYGVCARVFNGTGRNPIGAPVRTSGSSIDERSFMQQREALFRRAFVVEPFETRVHDSGISRRQFNAMDVNTKVHFASRIFANQITTNGCSASVLLSRPMSDWELTVNEVKKQQMKEKRAGKKKQKSDRPVEQDMEWLALPSDYRPTRMIGVDPGKRNLCTAYRDGDGTPRQHVIEISTAEYRHRAGMNKRAYWFENLKKREHAYSDALVRIPSFKTASFDTYLDRLQIYWRNVHFLISFSASHGFRKWRFFCRRMKMMALDALARRVVPDPSPHVLIGYGDWSRQDYIHGHPSVPVKGFRRALKRRATVVPVDEFRTSKLCSECHRPLKNALLPVHSGTQILVTTRNVLRCETSYCNSTLWARDVNASRNILRLLSAKLDGAERPRAFRRGVRT